MAAELHSIMQKECSISSLVDGSAEIGLVDLPDTALAAVAQFLVKTERGLIAVAMSAPSISWGKANWQREPLGASKTIATAKPLKKINLFNCINNNEVRKRHARKLTYDMSVLDFDDIDKELAARLTDADIGGVLMCIDAIHNMKKIKLTGCVGITGRCLEVLRGSTVLQQLDLSLVGVDDNGWPASPQLDPEPPISELVVIPILDSIIGSEGCSLGQLQLPKKWRVENSTMLSEFLTRYNNVLNSRGIVCSFYNYVGGRRISCSSICVHPNTNPWMSTDDDDVDYGVQQFTCYTCTKHYCPEHKDERTPDVCELCEKVRCTKCCDGRKTDECDQCSRITCFECTRIGYCDRCERTLCMHCCITNSSIQGSQGERTSSMYRYRQY